MGEAKPNGSIAQERLDSDLGDLFSRLGGLTPEQRFQISTALLKVDDLETPQVDGEIEAILRKVGEADKAAEQDIREGIDHIREELGGLGVTYLATNYWSPAVQHRQSGVACQPSFQKSAQRKRYAIAFFDITWEAEQRGNRSGREYWSLVQYLARADGARRPCTTQTVFGPRDGVHEPNPTHAVLRIDDDPITGPSFVTALPKYVAKLTAGLPYNAAKLPTNLAADDDSMLRDCLQKGHPLSRGEWLRSLSVNYQRVFEEALQDTDDLALADLRALTHELRIAYKHDDLAEEQVAFLMTMQALWRQAFDGKILYAFPTFVNNERSIVTAADIDTHLNLLSGFGRSLFSNLLFLDYGSWRGTAERRAYQSFVAHNLPKLVFAPAAAELRVIERNLDGGDVLPGGAARDLVKNVHHIKSLLEHYESLMGRFRTFKSQTDHPGFPTKQEPIEYNALLPRIHSIFGVLKDRVLDETLRKKLVLCAPPTDLHFQADFEFVTEILVNLISNAVDAITPAAVAARGDRAVITLTVERAGERIQFVVQDKGAGIKSETSKDLRERIERFASADLDDWNAQLDEILSDRYSSGHSMEKTGLGIPLSAAYLSQLQWDEQYDHKAGRIEIPEGNSGEVGTKVVVTLPQPRPKEEEVLQPADTLALPEGASSERTTAILTFDEFEISEWTKVVPGIKPVRNPGEASHYDIVVIDADIPNSEHLFSDLPTTSLELMQLFRNPARYEDLPRSVQALEYLDQRRAKINRPGLLIFNCKHDPAPAVVQELVLAGADSICTSNNRSGCLQEIYSMDIKSTDRLTRSRTRSRFCRIKSPSKRIMVVENSRSVCLSLRKRLEPDADLYFVGSQFSGNDFHVDTKLAVKYYRNLRKDGPIAAIISDLELDELGEREADRLIRLDRKAYINEEAANPGNIDKSRITIHKTIRTMRSIQQAAIDKGDEPFPIFFLSDYTRISDIVVYITGEFAGRDFNTFTKNQRGFEDLEKTVRNLLPPDVLK